MNYVTYSGRIAYLHDKDGENGREWFTVTTVPGEERTLRARCEMDEIGLLRDVTFSTDHDFNARDAFNRLRVNGVFAGSAWFAFDENEIVAEGVFPDLGRLSQRRRLRHPTPIFACHPLLVDGWHAAACDRIPGDGIKLLEDATNSSMMLDGSTAPLLGVVRKGIEFIGQEDVTCPAGRFAARRYRIHPMRVEAPDWTPLDFWVHGTENILIKLRWDMIEMTYILTELDAPSSIAQRLV